jgi:hypothetical protein
MRTIFEQWRRLSARLAGLVMAGVVTAGAVAAGVVAAGVVTACDDSSTPDGADGPDDEGASTNAASQTPPQEKVAMAAWLSKGDYKSWQCEQAVSTARSMSPHGFNRVCSNDVISRHAADGAPWPAGAAAVKEFYASATASTPNGYAVYLKTQADSAQGANWYFYARVPAEDGSLSDSVPVDGLGAGPCVSCHSAAGSDAEHRPSPSARDFVYKIVE